MNKTNLFLSATLLLSIGAQSFATRRLLAKTLTKFSKRFCRILVHKPSGLCIEPTNCNNCLLGAGITGDDPIEGACGNFVNREREQKEMFPVSLQEYKEIEV